MKYKIILCVALFFSIFSAVHATTAITSFTAGITSASSGQLMALSWAGQDVSGYNLLVSCQLGVKVKNQDGSVFPCGTKTGVTGSSIPFYLINDSGSNQTVTFQLFPVSTSGTEYTAGMMSQNVTISTAPYPLSSVTATATTTVPGGTTTLNWTSTDLDGVNIMISCATGVSATSTSETDPDIPFICGQQAFPDKLTGSTGSVTLAFKNSNQTDQPVTVTVLPYIGSGSYDLSHSQSVTIDVASDKVSPPQLLSFVPSSPTVGSDDNVILSWTSKNSSGVNLQMMCAPSLSVSTVLSTGTQVLPCNALMFGSLLASNGSVTLIFHNTSVTTQYASITLLTAVPGGYDGVNTKTLSIPVVPQGQMVAYANTASTSAATTGTNVSGTSAAGTSSSGLQTTVSPRKKFLKSLGLGSRGDDVSALQEFLSKAGYYPEGLVTGYFGPATTRAVGRFQTAMGIVQTGGPGYGNAGPLTRSKLNSL